MGKATALKVVTLDEVQAYRNPEAAKVVIDAARGTCTLKFRYSYEVDLERIKSERDLLAWVRHLAGKPWMTGQRLELFIDAVARHKGFSVDM
jgi:hypothetical protein